jgi:hypothetical protein
VAERAAIAERAIATERAAVSHAHAASRQLAAPLSFDDSERTVAAPPRSPVTPAEPEVPHFTSAQQELEPVSVAVPQAPAAPAALAAEAVAASGEPAPQLADDRAAQSRTGKKNARSRRASVPSWDEIMLGSSRQRD